MPFRNRATLVLLLLWTPLVSASAKVVASAPGATANDIAWLKLDVVSRRGSGVLSNVTTVQRINTVGGKLDDACDRPGDSHSMPYTADYVFLRKG